jgi:PAS domain S-box-containing protein
MLVGDQSTGTLKELPVRTAVRLANWVSTSRWRLFLLFLSLLVVPIGLFAYSANRILKLQSENQAKVESGQLARISASLVGEHFRQATILLESIATRRTLREAWTKNNHDLVMWHLQSAASLRPDFSFVSMYDVDGRMRAIYPPEPAVLGQSFAHRDWYKGVSRNDRPYISEVYQSAVPPFQMVVAIAVPVRDESGRLIGILMGADSLDRLGQQLEETRLEGGWTILLADQRGNPAARRNGKSAGDTASAVDLNANELVQLLAAARNQDEHDGHKVEGSFVSYATAGQSGWGVLVEKPASTLHQGLRDIEKRVWLLGLVFLALGLGLSVIMGTLYSQLETGNRFIKLSVDMFCIIGFDGFFKSLNPSWERTLGFTARELMSRPRFEFIHPEDRALTGLEADRLQGGKITFGFENRYLCKDGSYKWLLWNAISEPAQNAIYAVARDITERKYAERSLSESESRYRKLFELNPQPTWIYDLETLRFLAVNRAAIEAYGYSQEEFLSMTILDIRPPEEVPALIENLAMPDPTKKEYGIWQHRKKDGSLMPVEITSSSFEYAGKAARFVIAVDVTERKQSEKERQEFTERLAIANRELEVRNREVERATRMKSKFLASMSHELRTPLNAIVGFSDLLADQTPGQLNPKQQRFVNHIKTGSVHLLQLINDILDLSKIEAGLIEFHCQDFLVADTLPEVLSTIRPLAMAKSIRVQERIETKRAVYADRIRFKQILYNLLSNAVKFTPKNGQIDIHCYDDGAAIALSVTDTGIGIRPEDQTLVFEEFRQVDGTPGEIQEGTGLGLAITKRLVEQQGGTIRLESDLGKGCRFTFTLPPGVSIVEKDSATSAMPVCTAQEKEKEGSHKPLILIVDDESSARELLASYLETEYRVALADSGAEAVTKARELLPDAITLDVLMKGATGFDCLVGLRASPETRDIPVIIVSILDQQKVGFALGAADYLIKPINKSALLEAIRRHVMPQTDCTASILLVDDDVKTLELVGETLHSAGYTTQSVQNGKQALEVLRTKKVEAVLLDIMMPDMDGFQVIHHVRSEHALRNLPIIVMTGKTLNRGEVELLNRDTQAFFQKAGSWQQQLANEVRRILQRRAAATGAGRV